MQGWLADAEIYDPSTNVWTVLPMLTSHGVEHTATLMSDGRVLVVGGAIGGGMQSDQVEIFDPQTDTWYGAMPIESDRASHTAQLLEDGRVLVVGGGSANGNPAGGDALVYDPQMNTWTATGPMVNMRINGKSVRLSDGRVLVVGGINLIDSINSVRMPLTSAEIYDPTTNTWAATGSLSQARYGHVLTLLQDGRVLVSGGAHDRDCCWTSDSYASLIEIYDPLTGVWDLAGTLPQPGVDFLRGSSAQWPIVAYRWRKWSVWFVIQRRHLANFTWVGITKPHGVISNLVEKGLGVVLLKL